MNLLRKHVLPVNDFNPMHAAQMNCPCHPTETEPGIAIHNAWDCREKTERRTGDKSSDGWIIFAEYEP